jgi:hypothetical protein
MGFDYAASARPIPVLLIAVSGWMNRRQLQVIEYLREENRVLREQLGGQRALYVDFCRSWLADGLQRGASRSYRYFDSRLRLGSASLRRESTRISDTRCGMVVLWVPTATSRLPCYGRWDQAIIATRAEPILALTE